MVIFDEEQQKRKLFELRLKEEEDLAKALSTKYSIPYLDLTSTAINTDALRLIPEAAARSAQIAAFHIVGKKLYIGTASPTKEETKKVIAGLQAADYIVFPAIVSKRGLERAWERYKEISLAEETQAGILEVSQEKVLSYKKDFKTLKDVVARISEILSTKKRFQTSGLLEVFIAGALSTDASDVHIEPEENNVGVRFRLDGVLRPLLIFDFDVYQLLQSRIKLISGMRLNVKNEAQDGRFSIKLNDTEMEIRSSVVPGAYGESIVMRLLNPDTISVPLEALGMEPKLLAILTHEISKPNGMLLNTGPTGSGKTTTLYAFLKKVQTPEMKIITIEDPIEYHLPGITQTQVNTEKKYTFASGLRAGLRQDPDIIMVGEIRDEETAKTAVNAALTGHLVLSTLHTNNAAGTIPRLIDLKVNAKIISSALNVSIAQRLVRKLCQFCKEKSTPSARERTIIDSALAGIHREETYDPGTLWRPKGCERCNNTGYRGRIGVFEAILTDESVEQATIQNPSEREIKKAGLGQGILDMRQDGIIKILQGVTSFEELERVVDVEKDS
ncbi:MAG TPA: type II/IV secretion system protein [Candidatus Paceibacterota bacterium]